MVCLSYALYFYWWEGAGPHPNSPTTSLENGPGLLQTRCVSKLRGEFEDQDHCLSLNIYIYTVYIYIFLSRCAAGLDGHPFAGIV